MRVVHTHRPTTMTITIRLLSALLIVLSAASVFAQSGEDALAALHALLDADWDRSMSDDPVMASYYGDLRFNDKWGDASPAALAARHRANQTALQRLTAIDPSALPLHERVTYDLFERKLRSAIERHRYRNFNSGMSALGGVQKLDEVREYVPFETARHHDDWISRLRGVGTVVDQSIERMRVVLREGRTEPRVVLERVVPQIAGQVVEKPEDSPFYIPFREMPSTIPAAEQERLRNEARRAIAEVVIPAYTRLQTFFVGTYLPRARASIGLWDVPEGPAYYRHIVRHATTTDLTPEEIHQIGLREVARIRKEMDAAIRKTGFEGTFEEFTTFLRTDPRFYYKDPQELLDAYRAICKRIDPELVKLFGRLPRIPYGVMPIPENSAPSATTAYYNGGSADGTRAGMYYVNLYKPETRPKYEMEALSAHESVPGHHLQISLATELGELPKFRRYEGYGAFWEGWALYAESLGEDLGLYQDPYSKFGQLMFEMWRALRLVVDTGIHVKRWSREQAVEYMRANSAKSEHNINVEVDRYIASGGGAVSYKIGEMKIKELRKRAQEKLGDDFDIRGFHDAVLELGAVPLDVLEQHVDRWIASGLKAPKVP